MTTITEIGESLVRVPVGTELKGWLEQTFMQTAMPPTASTLELSNFNGRWSFALQILNAMKQKEKEMNYEKYPRH